MIFVDRQQVELPASLAGTGVQERADAIAHYEAVPPPDDAFPYKAYKKDDVKQALNNLFGGKCAYCESIIQNHPMDVEHYRPKNAVVIEGQRQLKKPGYYWLGADWDNLLPSCIDCNRRRTQELPDGDSATSGKANLFPVRNEAIRASQPDDPLDDEGALLLHPCHDNPRPEDHLEFIGEGLIRPKLGENDVESDYGAATIDVCGLQRLGLVSARRAHYLLLLERFEDLFLLRDLLSTSPGNAMIEQMVSERFTEKLALLDEMAQADQPYAGMVRQLLPRLKKMNQDNLSWAQAVAALDPGITPDNSGETA